MDNNKNKITTSISKFDEGEKRSFDKFCKCYREFHHKHFSIDDRSCLYENGFNHPAFVVSAYSNNGKKIGHASVFIRKAIGRSNKYALLSDLYVDEEYRNISVVGSMYSVVKKHLYDEGVQSFYTVTNEKSEQLAKFFLQADNIIRLNFRVSCFFSSFLSHSQNYDVTTDFLNSGHDQFKRPFLNEVFWNPDRLKKRIQLKHATYRAFMSDNQILISRNVIFFGVPMVVICGVFGKEKDRPKKELLKAACAGHKTPFCITKSSGSHFGSISKLTSRKLATKSLSNEDISQLQLLDLDIL